MMLDRKTFRRTLRSLKIQITTRRLDAAVSSRVQARLAGSVIRAHRKATGCVTQQTLATLRTRRFETHTHSGTYG